jgi:hypothetical protein
VLSRATSFLKQAADNAETQQALVDLAKHVFTHPETLDVVVELARKLVNTVLNSQESLDEVRRRTCNETYRRQGLWCRYKSSPRNRSTGPEACVGLAY